MTEVIAAPLKCFAVVVRHDISEVYVFAETRDKARWIAMRGYMDAGYKSDWSQVSSSRKKEYDIFYRPEFKNKYLRHEQMVSGRLYS